jgi:hypothetical protein
MLVYVQGVLWQQNVANIWYSRVSGRWTTGTATSPLLGYPLFVSILEEYLFYFFIYGKLNDIANF